MCLVETSKPSDSVSKLSLHSTSVSTKHRFYVHCNNEIQIIFCHVSTKLRTYFERPAQRLTDVEGGQRGRQCNVLGGLRKI